MKIIPLKAHRAFDYVLSIVLISAPWVFNFSQSTAATWFSVLGGINILLNNILTGIFINMRIHLTIDSILSIIILTSPWLFGFSEIIYLPHLVLGSLALMISFFTEGSHHRYLNHKARMLRMREPSF